MTSEFDSDVDAIVAGVRQATGRYQRLLLVVGANARGKSDVLAAVSERLAAPVANVGLELSRRMLPLATVQRRLQAGRLLGECVADVAGDGADTVLLDHTELLFDASLRQDPLRLLAELSRNWTVVAAWTGVVDSGALRYAAPDHPEHRSYPAEHLSIVTVGTQTP